MAMCTPFWWGFDLPLAWVNAGITMGLLALALVLHLLQLIEALARRAESPSDQPVRAHR